MQQNYPKKDHSDIGQQMIEENISLASTVRCYTKL